MSRTQQANRDPTVWLVQEPSSPRADLSSAQRYGKLVFLLSKRDNPSLTPGLCLAKIVSQLDGYRPGDFIAAAPGDQAGILLVGIALERLRLTRGELTWLRWERERAPNGERLVGAGFYVPSTLTRD